jgi:hypothetical protein
VSYFYCMGVSGVFLIDSQCFSLLLRDGNGKDLANCEELPPALCSILEFHFTKEGV